jgi:hypothetical protein
VTDIQSALVSGPRLICITAGYLRSSCWGRPPWREDGSVIYSYNLLSLTGPSPAELMTTSYCLIRDSPNLEGQVPVFISPRNRVAQLYPRKLGSLSIASYDSQGYGGSILNSFHTGRKLCRSVLDGLFYHHFCMWAFCAINVKLASWNLSLWEFLILDLGQWLSLHIFHPRIT